MAHAPELRVLCFGASITGGHYSWGLQHHPYARRLESRLRTALPSHQLTVVVDGLSGDRVIRGNYISRLKPHFDADAGRNFDWLIFQGGGNDMVWGEESAAIFEAMKELWQIGSQGGAKVMALTVTDTQDQRPLIRERYSKLNEMIKVHQQENFFVADVFSKIPYASMSKEMRKKVWDDGLHFKPLGYDMLGDAVADRLLEILQRASLPNMDVGSNRPEAFGKRGESSL
ncbi:MAG: hypothetical protein Q9171_003110 [Xanthocarpia ochracea]